MKKIILPVLLTLFHCSVYAQFPYVHFGVEGQAGITTSDVVPFWMRANQFGSVPLSGPSASFLASARVEYDSSRTRLVDWGAGIQGRANGGKGSNVTLLEGYGKLRIGIFELKGGRLKETMGLSDTLLTSGNYAISGNALGIPKIQISIPEFYALPFWGKVLAFKGNFAHGWIGKTPVQYGDTNMTTTQFHQKSLYGRFGKPGWKLKLYGGFNHQVFFGDEKYVWSEKGFNKNRYKLSAWQTYQYVIFGQVWNSSKVGNHLGSIDLGFDYQLKNTTLLAYHQFFYEVGGLAHLSNIADGLSGISLTNRRTSTSKFRWNKLLLEVLYTKSQGGGANAKVTPSGDEDYYNNYMYSQGWSYQNVGLGTPFISTASSTRSDLPHYPYDYFINNRVLAFHFGADLSIGKWSLLSKISYSQNFGTYGTSEYGHTTGKLRTESIYGIFERTDQLSTYFDLNREIKKGLRIGALAAFDTGKLLYNSSGLILKVSQTF